MSLNSVAFSVPRVVNLVVSVEELNAGAVRASISRLLSLQQGRNEPLAGGRK
jgi:hypothetical protein